LNRRILIGALIPTVGWLLVHAIFLIEHQIGLEFAFTDAALFAVPLGMAAWIGGITLRYYRPDWKRIPAILIWTATEALIIIYLYDYLAESLGQMEWRINAQLSQGNTLLFLLVYFVLNIFTLFVWIWLNNLEKESIDKRQLETEKLAKESELEGLKLQLQPHFLFNSLNSVNALLHVNPEEASRMVLLLSDFFRSSLKKSQDTLITLHEELETVQLYLQIEEIRFASRLMVEIKLQESCNELKLPALILQPIIENAIKHGLYGTTEKVEIHIEALNRMNQLILRVSNPYTAEDSSISIGTGFGLKSVNRRLHLIYARNDLMKIEKDQEKFVVQLTLPQ
jgi:two-component system, LytTR family, sensor kinase